MNKIKDQKYHDELLKEIELKESRAMLLLQEVQFLRSLKGQVESGLTQEEIKAGLEHNPFDDFDFFGTKRRYKNG